MFFIKLSLILCLIFLNKSINCQNGGSNYTSTENFGRIYSKSNYVNVCLNPVAYGFVNRAGTYEYYMISDILMNWIDGENYCQKYEAHLPSISAQSDLDYLRCLFESSVLVLKN